MVSLLSFGAKRHSRGPVAGSVLLLFLALVQEHRLGVAMDFPRAASTVLCCWRPAS